MHESKRKAFIVTLRLQFFPATVTLFFMGWFWGLNQHPDLNIVVISLLGFATIGLSNLIGLHINMISDYELDKTYKSDLPAAIDTLGRSTFNLMFITECIIALFLVLYLMIDLNRPILLIMWIIGMFFAIGYSIKPFRFKSNPIMNPISLILVLCVFPMVWIYYLFTPTLTLPFVVFCIGISLGVIGLVIPTEIEDFPEDLAMGVRNLTQALGLALACSFAIVAASLSVTIASIGAGLAFMETEYLWFWIPATIIMIIIHGYVIRKLFQLKGICRQYETSSETHNQSLMNKIKEITHNSPKWFGAVAWSGLFAGFLLYLSKIM